MRLVMQAIADGATMRQAYRRPAVPVPTYDPKAPLTPSPDFLASLEIEVVPAAPTVEPEPLQPARRPPEPFYDVDDEDRPASEVASPLTPLASAMLGRYRASSAPDRVLAREQQNMAALDQMRQAATFDNMRIASGLEAKLSMHELWEVERERVRGAAKEPPKVEEVDRPLELWLKKPNDAG
jgi:hypothetical protein